MEYPLKFGLLGYDIFFRVRTSGTKATDNSVNLCASRRNADSSARVPYGNQDFFLVTIQIKLILLDWIDDFENRFDWISVLCFLPVFGPNGLQAESIWPFFSNPNSTVAHVPKNLIMCHMKIGLFSCGSLVDSGRTPSNLPVTSFFPDQRDCKFGSRNFPQ